MINSKAKVLLIEDDPIDEMLVNHALKTSELDFNVTWVSTLQEALDAIVTTNFSAIIADLSLGDSDTKRTIRALSVIAKSIPTIAYTGVESDELEKWVLEVGFKAYLVKGVSGFRKLAEVIQDATKQDATQDLFMAPRFDD